MYFWYLMVVVSSLFENFAGVPFSKQWTIRVSRAPSGLRISEDAPVVTANAVAQSQSLLHLGGMTSSIDALTAQRSNSSSNNGVPKRRPVPSETALLGVEDPPMPPLEMENSLHKTNTIFSQRTDSGLAPGQRNDSNTLYPFSNIASDVQTADLLQDLDTGYNTTGRVHMDPNEPWSLPRVPFYVIISLEDITKRHAVLRVISKAISVGVFAAGTATFASATLITISVALTVLCM